jgi:hypothetical protein
MTWTAFWHWLQGRVSHFHPEPDAAFEHESDALQVDINQVERVNAWLLDKAVARGQITPEMAEVIRTTHASDASPPLPEPRDSGTHPSPSS